MATLGLRPQLHLFVAVPAEVAVVQERVPAQMVETAEPEELMVVAEEEEDALFLLREASVAPEEREVMVWWL